MTKNWPLWASLGMLSVMVAVLILWSLRLNDGHLVYTLDDTYILMSTGRSLGLHGVWGLVAEQGFTSPSSSLLYTVLLAGVFFIFGQSTVAPLAINVVAGVILTVAIDMILRFHGMANRWRFIWTVLTLLIIPAPLLIVSGNEHLLQTTISILFIFFASRMLGDDKKNKPYDWLWMVLLAPLASSIRYEGCFLVAVVGVLFFIRRRFVTPLTFGALALLPIVGFGLYSISQGWYFIPNSVLLKGDTPELSLVGIIKVGVKWYYKITREPDVFAALILNLTFISIIVTHRKSIWRSDVLLVAITFLATVLHAQFAKFGGFCRYEAYLIGMGALGVGAVAPRLRDIFPDLHQHLKNKSVAAAYCLLLFILVSPLFWRAALSYRAAPYAAHNIYEQQIQTAAFAARFYSGKTVAVNDIGAVSFYGNVRVCDIWGLSSLDIARARRENNHGPQIIDAVTEKNDVVIAMVYEDWYAPNGGLPKTWVKVGEWAISDNMILGGEVVSFYAVKPDEEASLIENLKKFSSSLPPEVQQRGRYRDAPGSGI